MSFLNQPGIYALVSTNSLEAARNSRIYAVIRICYGNDEDSIAIAYAKIGEDSMGYEIPNAPVMVHGKMEKVPVLGGQLWLDVANMARIAMGRVKAEHKKVPPSSLFKVYKDASGKSIVEQIGEVTE